MRRILRTTMLAVMAMMCGLATATTVVFDPAVNLGSQAGSSTGEDQVTVDGITISASPTGSFGNGQQYRVYKGSTFTISSTIGNITSVSFTCTANDDAKYGPGCFTDCTTGSYTYSGSDGNWTGNASQISWTASTNQVRMTSITVVVGAPEPQKLSISGKTPFKGSTTVTITPSNPDFAVYYTTDGSNPVSSGTSKQYTTPFTITETTTVKAYEEDYDGNESDIVEMTFVKEESAGSGDGTLSDPFNAIAATELASSLEVGQVTDNDYYIKGKISQIKYTFSASYGTATFFISDDGSENDQFQIYSTYYLENKSWVEGNTQIKLGDDVIICGKLTNYNGTPETASKQSYLYSLNGKTTDEGETPQPGQPTGTGTLEDPFNSVAANNVGAALEEGAITDQAYYIKGKIASIANNGEFSEKFGNATFYISDDGSSAGQFYVFRTLFLENKPWVEGNTQIKVGDEVIVYGKITNYKGTTPETVQGETYLYSLNGKTSDEGETPQPGQPTGTGTLEDPFNSVAANNVGAALEEGAITDQAYYIKGKIASIANNGEFSEKYGNASFYISDDGTDNGQFYVFRTLFLENKPWVEGNTQIKVGDEVIVYGKITNYKGTTPETVQGETYLYSLNGKTSDEGETPQPGQPTGTGSLEDPFNSVAANNVGAALEEGAITDQAYYIKGKIASIANNGEFSEKFGNASFYISDDGTDNGQFYVFRTLFLENKPWVEGNTQIKVGDEVIVYGKITNYKGTTPETVQGETYLYSLNGKTSDEGETPQPGQPTGTGSLEDPFNSVAANNVGAALEAGAITDQAYYIKGKIASIANNGEFSERFGNASFYISDDGTDNGQFLVWRTLYLENKPWVEGNTQIKVGDEVIVYGKITNYNGTTPETVQGETYLYSLNGKTTDETQQQTTEVADIAAFKALENGTEAVLLLNNAQVLYVGSRDVYVRDASGAIDLYNLGLTFENGQILNGKITGKKATYNDIPEMAKTDATNDENLTKEAGTAQPVNVSIAEARSPQYYCDLISIENVNVKAVETESGQVNYYAYAGDTELQVYDKFGIGFDFAEKTGDGFIYNIAGILVPWKGDYELYYTSVDVTTGIQHISDAVDTQAPLYNLSGQQVDKSYKGIVIQNGHKFILK